MKTSTKIWLIVAAALVFLGTIMFSATLFFADWDFSKISTTKYEQNSYNISDSFENIWIDTDTADIKFLLSGNGECKVECFEEKKARHEVKIENGTLFINEKEVKAWYDYINIGFGTPKITVYLPKADFSSVYIKESTGDISFSKLSVKDIDLSLSTGDILLSDVKCENLVTKGSTGEVELKKVIASNKFDIKRSTGDIELNVCDAAEIFIETDTGDVEGSLLSPKTFATKTSTGEIHVPQTNEGGLCQITTSTGDIEIYLGEK